MRMPRRRRNRRGFTLVVMMLLLAVFIGSAAFATEFGKMYLVRGQLQAAADAGALAGIYLVAQGWKDSTVDSARAYTARHKVLTSTYVGSTALVAPGYWKDTLACSPANSCQGFVVNGNDWNDPAVDAVRVIVNYTASYSYFGRVLGFNSRALYDTAVAIRGSATSSTCVRPWAIPYQALLDVLHGPPGTLNPLTYSLTTADIDSLRDAGPSKAFPLKVGTAGDLTPNGEFYAARLPPGQYADGTAGNPWSGGNDYSNGISFTCAQLLAAMKATGSSKTSVSVGDYLKPETGNKEGPTRQGINDMCGGDTCNPPVKIAAALWDGIFDVTFCTGCYRVKYIGAFAVTGWDQTNKQVWGYFTSMAIPGSGGTISTGGPPGPAQSTGLRK